MIFDVFSSEKSACLDNSPVVHVKHIDPRVQEDKRDSTEQCKIMYNSQSRSCKPEVYPSIPYCPTVYCSVLLYQALHWSLSHALQLVCSELWCVDEQGECKTKGIPAADGTGCYITNTQEKGVSISQPMNTFLKNFNIVKMK